MPCGFDLTRPSSRAPGCSSDPSSIPRSRVFCVDANACFSRPGPRIVDGIEILADLLHPRDGEVPPGAARVR